MSVPFGGHPKLKRFVDWLVSVGCKAEIKVRNHSQTGQPYQSLEISNPNNGRVAIANPDLEEHLTPSMVSYLQRRVGLKSPFPGEPEQPSPDTEYVEQPN